MIFASGIFLFIFLPAMLIGYWLLRNRSVTIRNAFLLLMSAGFYLESGLGQMILLFLSITFNYLFARGIANAAEADNDNRKKSVFIFAIAYNIGMLFVFKYLAFIGGEINTLFSNPLIPDRILSITLPLGISFYTFQALSYVVDVYRDSSLVERNPINVALYISFFPQLIAGPIVRWESIRNDLRTKIRIGGGYNYGFRRFALGLGKKVIIANQMAIFADKAFALLKSGELTTTFAWLGAVAYTLQIYFDFSGYSDMAIGLGQVLGFRFPENFNYPYISSSITEFWRRWHMSLSSWFRDYVYIPLGGNRCSKGRMFFNLFVVWMLTGIWHGANYTFWLWGCVYFILLMIEKTLSDRPHIHAMYKDKIIAGRLLKVFGHIYTLLTVILLWVIFRADSVLDAFRYIIYMFGRTEMSAYASGVTGLYLHSFIGYGTLAVIGCIPWKRILEKKLPYKKENKVLRVADGIWVIAVFFIACCMTLDGDYNPFIYFNF